MNLHNCIIGFVNVLSNLFQAPVPRQRGPGLLRNIAPELPHLPPARNSRRAHGLESKGKKLPYQ
jgi:hypothetical protein